MNKYLFLATLILLSLSVFAQEPLMWQLTEEDGLPSSTVYRTLQDRDGYIWVATTNGLCRYDGKEFKRYPIEGLSSNEIIQLKEDYWGRIWFLTLKGKLYYIQNDQPVLCLIEKSIEGLESINNFVFVDTLLWIHDQKLGTLRFSYNQNFDIHLLQKYTKQITISSFREIFVTSGKKIVGLPLKGKLPFDDPFVHFVPFEGYLINVLTINKDSVLYQVPQQTRWWYNGTISEVYTTEENVNFALIKNDELWLLTTNGIQIVDYKKGQLKDHYLKGIATNTVFTDREGSHWIATAGNGVYIIPKLTSLQYTRENSSLNTTQVLSLIQDDENNNIVLGQDKGLMSFVNKREIVSSYQTTLKEGISNIRKDINGDYWISGNILGIVKTNLQGRENEILSFSRMNFSVKSMVLDNNNNNILIASSQHIHKYSINNNTYSLPRHDFITIKRSYALHYTSERLWLGTLFGLYYYKDHTLFPFLEKKEQIPYKIYDIISTPDSSIWVATEGSGILQIKNDSIVNRYIINEERYNKLTSNQNAVWVAATNGVYKINRKNGEITHINRQDGLPTKTINTILADGKDIWMGTNKGLVYFPAQTNFINTAAPPIHLTGFQIHDKNTLLEEYYDLTYKQDNITIEYIGLGYRCRGEMNYRYRLLGLDTTWRETKERQVRYPILNAGEYTFEVLAVNEDGTASELPAVVSFEIHPAFWQTWWFQLGSTSLIFLIFGSVIYVRQQQKRKRENFEKETKLRINELRMSALQSQVNPHFIFNALNSIQHYLSENDRGKAMDYLARFAKMIRSIFEQSKEKLISLQEEISFLNLYLDLEKLRFSNKVAIKMDISPELGALEYSIKLPPLLIQPILENAFKHGLFHKKGMGHLQIYFELYEKDYLKCTVEDDGVGRKQAASLGWQNQKNHQSSGVGFTQERLNIHNGRGSKGLVITDLTENGKSKGTKVELYIRIGA